MDDVNASQNTGKLVQEGVAATSSKVIAAHPGAQGPTGQYRQKATAPAPGAAPTGAQILRRVADNIETVIYGKREAIELVLFAVIAKGHVLIEDVPGVGKTSLVSALAKSISCNFKRIQFTPDVMPSDVTGFSVFNQKTREFEFRQGGVMSNIVLADEINRASAKTQSSLLEAMEERQVTVDSVTYRLREPFVVLATENPIESFGTYPLPEAQIDRFLIRISLGYPAFEQEARILNQGRAAKERIGAVCTQGDILQAIEEAAQVYVSPHVTNYIIEIVSATRTTPELQLGSSPRGSIALSNLAKAYALYRERNFVIPDDVKYLAPFVLSHRVSLSHEARIEGRSEHAIIDSILSSIAVPVDEAYRQ
jgi:MoxR-like ATPase